MLAKDYLQSMGMVQGLEDRIRELEATLTQDQVTLTLTLSLTLTLTHNP